MHSVVVQLEAARFLGECRIRPFPELPSASASDGPFRAVPRVLRAQARRRARAVRPRAVPGFCSPRGALTMPFVPAAGDWHAGESLFAPSPTELPRQPQLLATRILHLVLELSCVAKAYLRTLSRQQLIEAFCELFRCEVSCNLPDTLKAQSGQPWSHLVLASLVHAWPRESLSDTQASEKKTDSRIRPCVRDVCVRHALVNLGTRNSWDP
mmetsp:Transcript_135100/g.431730  ORF Transcript_135100/g.431730 Transcript_135100/m.431730 type:complete len:211 (-) Transcript_135100:190-822(-)